MAYELPDLPYAYDALQPTIDEQTMRIHDDKHHGAYIDNLNKERPAVPQKVKSREPEGLQDLTVRL